MQETSSPSTQLNDFRSLLEEAEEAIAYMVGSSYCESSDDDEDLLDRIREALAN